MLEQFQPEIDALKANGHEILGHLVWDSGKSIVLRTRKNGKDSKFVLYVSCYDENGVPQGALDIRKTDWSKYIRGVECSTA